MKKLISTTLLGATLAFTSLTAQAELVEMNDAQLRETTGELDFYFHFSVQIYIQYEPVIYPRVKSHIKGHIEDIRD
ncbi:MAG TPA: hypothetical protein DCZ03_12770 [Gammaproteobacteria bacterium]|nr:hypothetical protein [Gammaproteobacteria bacterium]